MTGSSGRRGRGGRAAGSISAIVVLAAAGLSLWLVARDVRMPAPAVHDGGTDAGAALDDGGGILFAYAEADAAADDRRASPVGFVGDLALGEPHLDAGGGATLPDGTPVPPLPLSAPRQTRFGVVLVSYAGAQPSPSGGKPSARSRAEAKALAAKLLDVAEHDFRGAVQQGDPGSSEDVGSVKLGVLEPAPEYVLFTLPIGGVGGPVDTPRGYWILKRLE